MTSGNSLSGDDAIHAILADIPLYAAGVLAFGIFTVCLITRRLNWATILLYFSAFAAFIAGILDLSQLLLRFGRDVKLESVTGTITAREIFLALSFGMRFAFFWFFVAQSLTDVVLNAGQPHNASWERWGLFGVLLKWTLALLCAAIALLQILYRTVDMLAKFGPVYEVECAAQIVTSACFIMKIVLNGYLITVSGPSGEWKWQPCAVYTPVILALGISIVIGVGNMLSFLWSDTVVGRVLQAIEYYLLVVAVAINTIHFAQRKSVVQTWKMNRSSSFRGLGPMNRTTFRISCSPFTDLSGSQNYKMTDHGQKPSVVDRLSSFLVPRHMSQLVVFPLSSTNDKLWNQGDGERGLSPILHSINTHGDSDTKMSRASLDEPASEAKQHPDWQNSLFRNGLGQTSCSPEEILANAALRSVASPSTLAIPSHAFARFTPPSSHADSPIYGLGGRQTFAERSSLSDPDSQRSSSYSQILRQQAELDKSIASLKLLARDIIDDTAIPEDRTSSSASQRSESTLSHFPEPPWTTNTDTDYVVRRNVTPVVTLSRAESVQSHRPIAGDTALLPPKIPAATEHARNASVPYSDMSDAPLPSGRARVDSEGTQYEITSFIGHLTHKKDASTATSVTNSSGGSTPPRGGVLTGTSPELASSVDFPLPPRASLLRPFGLPSRPRLNTTFQKLSPLAESAISPQDVFESPRNARSYV